MKWMMDDAGQRFRHDDLDLDSARVHVVQVGAPDAAPVVFLHGFPESWREWRAVMAAAARDGYRAVALDLPGVGGSRPTTQRPVPVSKAQIAATVHELVDALGLTDVTLVGHDIGGMVVYAYLRRYPELARAVIMDIVLPGVPPWEDFVRQPFLWHFAFHAIPQLPESLVQGRQREYFDYFYDVLAADPAAVTAEMRAAYADAYGSDAALSSAFGWFRAFAEDVEHNRRAAAQCPPVATPLLYMRGEHERSGSIDSYVAGLRGVGLASVEPALVPNAGHFPPEEAPEPTWRLIRQFVET